MSHPEVMNLLWTQSGSGSTRMNRERSRRWDKWHDVNFKKIKKSQINRRISLEIYISGGHTCRIQHEAVGVSFLHLIFFKCFFPYSFFIPKKKFEYETWFLWYFIGFEKPKSGLCLRQQPHPDWNNWIILVYGTHSTIILSCFSFLKA